MAKKKRRRSGGGAEAQQRRQERLQARREAKERELRARARREQRQRVVRIVAIVAVVGVVLWFFFLRTSTPEAIAGHDVLSFSTDNGGAQTHEAPYSYNEETTGIKPPVSGRHNPNPAECGVHDAQVPDANFVHTLEHGTVAILYQPDLPPDQIKKLESIVSSFDDHTYSSPYKDLPSPIVVASWAHKMLLENVDEDAIREYIDTFKTSAPAPEPDQKCPNTADAPFTPKPSPTPSPSPSPSKSPEDSGKKTEDKGAEKKADDKGADKSGGKDAGGGKKDGKDQ